LGVKIFVKRVRQDSFHEEVLFLKKVHGIELRILSNRGEGDDL